MIKIELFQLEYVVALSKYLHFTKAAEEINVSQPTLSHGIKKLEEELEVQLFIRSTRSILLTTAGKEFLIFAKKVLTEVQNAKYAMSSHANLNKGSIRIGAIPTVSYLGITSIIASFQRSYPGINMDIIEEDSNVLVNKMHSLDLDVAFISQNNSQVYDFKTYPLIKDKLVLLVERNHKIAAKNRINLSDIADEKFLIVTGLKNDFIKCCHLVNFEPNIILTSGQSLTINLLLEEGLGIVPCTLRVAKYLLSSNTRIVDFTPTINRTTYLAVANNNNVIISELFKKFALEKIRENMLY